MGGNLENRRQPEQDPRAGQQSHSHKADKIRKELETLGIILKDTREGTTYELK